MGESGRDGRQETRQGSAGIDHAPLELFFYLILRQKVYSTPAQDSCHVSVAALANMLTFTSQHLGVLHNAYIH